MPVLQALQNRWPEKCRELVPFYSKRDELLLFGGCILWGSMVIVPKKGHRPMLEELHFGHPRVSKMKSLTQIYTLWPGMIAMGIEDLVHCCESCQSVMSMPPVGPLQL